MQYHTAEQESQNVGIEVYSKSKCVLINVESLSFVFKAQLSISAF